MCAHGSCTLISGRSKAVGTWRRFGSADSVCRPQSVLPYRQMVTADESAVDSGAVRTARGHGLNNGLQATLLRCGPQRA
jgi:hypothetical protein